MSSLSVTEPYPKPWREGWYNSAMTRLVLPLSLLACSPVPLEDPDAAILCDTCDEVCTLEQETPDSAQHITGGLDYADPPPFGGDHDPCWAPWGIHTTEIPDENWVHNLEHGGVVILHNCGGCSEVAELEAWVTSQPEGTVLISPYAALSTAFAAVSWGRRLMTDCGDVETMQAFYDLYVDQAPESVVAPPPSS